MFQFTRILLVYSISGIFMLSGCMNRAPSLRMLDTRAGYNHEYDDEELALYHQVRSQGDHFARQDGPRIAKVYIFPHELASRDYFWGGYISLVVAKDEVTFDHPEKAGSEPQVYDGIETPSAAPTRQRPDKRKNVVGVSK